MQKFRNKYRIPSSRAPWWNYGWNAAYYVTICTKNRLLWFGDVVNREMILSDIGQMAQQCWMQIPEYFPFVKLDAYVIMPNHVHGILIIDKPADNADDGDDGSNDQWDGVVETQYFASLQSPKNKFGPQSKNLGSIIRGFKIGVTKYARNIEPDFSWQARYHDHIIRNEKSYYNIANYIINNPSNWKTDQFHPMNRNEF